MDEIVDILCGDVNQRKVYPLSFSHTLSVLFRFLYSTAQAFAAEVQEVAALCSVSKEVQVVSTSTFQGTPEVQLLFISTTHQGTTTLEQQNVVCDANGGEWR